MLLRLRPALDTEADKFEDIIGTWNASWVNSVWAAMLFGVPFMLLNAWSLLDMLAGKVQNTNTITDWFNAFMYGRLIAEWPPIMQGWYAVLFVGLTGFVLGSGVLGLLATMRLVHAILEEPVRLAYYRYLDAPVSLGSQLASWVLIALIGLAFFSRPLLWDLEQPIFISTLLQVAVALLVITLVFGLPVVCSRNAIHAAKEQVLAQPLQFVDELYNQLRATARVPLQPNTVDDLEAIQKQLDQVNKIIESIAAIPEWQISIVSGLRVSLAFVLSLVSPILIELVKNAILKAAEGGSTS
ncbi:MAG: hypothetical protein KDE19_05560 [Caldilineaceae bacterium]|nr:hypothetical protein [Caldilineaceae bacterium]